MPYAKLSDLPAPVRAHLPHHAQEIYRKAFNNAWDEYATHKDRDALSHKVAWAAVKKMYHKQGEHWVKKG